MHPLFVHTEQKWNINAAYAERLFIHSWIYSNIQIHICLLKILDEFRFVVFDSIARMQDAHNT